MNTIEKTRTRARQIIEQCCKNQPLEICPRRFEFEIYGRVSLAYFPNYSDNAKIMDLFYQIVDAIKSELNIPVVAHADYTLLF